MTHIIVGTAVLVLGLICWIGQTLVVFAPKTAVTLGLLEPPDEMDATMLLYERFNQGIMDVLLAWMLPAAALLMLLDHRWWPLLGLAGGSVYIYFAGMFMITRVVLKRHGLSVGRPSSVAVAHVLGTLWILSGLTMTALATARLSDGLA